MRKHTFRLRCIDCNKVQALKRGKRKRCIKCRSYALIPAVSAEVLMEALSRMPVKD